MCDDHTEADNEALFNSGALTRRSFGIGVGAASLALFLPSPANAMAVKGRDLKLATSDGLAEAYFVAPTKGKHPAVLIWPDIMGLRPAFRKMADRLAESGYSVLVVNQFYRDKALPILTEGEAFSQDTVRARLMGYRAKLTSAATESDAKAFVGWLDKQKQVDKKRGIGTTGYCMGGPMTMITAASLANRVRAGASFHGGGVASTKPDSPHLFVPKMKASFLFAIADNDDKKTPDEKVMLKAAFDAAKLPVEIEVYTGAQHGWCPPDSAVYNQEAAEKAWARMLALFEKTL